MQPHCRANVLSWRPIPIVLHEGIYPGFGIKGLEILRQGFRRGERVLRTAMVAVSEPENPAPAAAGPTDPGSAPASD